MPKQVTFSGEREGERVTVRALIDALQKMMIWLRGRDQGESVDWDVVRISLGDPIRMTLSSESANGLITQRMNNLHSLQNKRMPKTAPRLTDEDIEGTMELATVLGKGFKSIKISSTDTPTVKL